jgi:hypothetical protein
MALEIYEALTAANVPADKARAVAVSMDAAIDKRCALHKEQLFIKADGAKLKAEIIKWCMATISGAVALCAALVKVWQQRPPNTARHAVCGTWP